MYHLRRVPTGASSAVLGLYEHSMETQPVKKKRYILARTLLLLSGLAIVLYSSEVFYYVKTQTFKGFYVFTSLKVVKVFADSEAALNGIQKGDKVVKLNDQGVRSLADYLFLSGQLQPGQKSKVLIKRHGQEIPSSSPSERTAPNIPRTSGWPSPWPRW